MGAGLTIRLIGILTPLLGPSANCLTVPCHLPSTSRHPSKCNGCSQLTRQSRTFYPRPVLQPRFAIEPLRDASLGVRVSLAVTFALGSSRRSCPRCGGPHMEVIVRGSHIWPRGRAWLLLPLCAFSYSLQCEFHPRPRGAIRSSVLRSCFGVPRPRTSHVRPWSGIEDIQ